VSDRAISVAEVVAGVSPVDLMRDAIGAELAREPVKSNLSDVEEINLHGQGAVDAGIRAPRLRYVKVYSGQSLTEQLRLRLGACTTRDEVQALHLSICGSPSGKSASSGTRRRWSRLAADRMDAVDREARERAAARPVIVSVEQARQEHAAAAASRRRPKDRPLILAPGALGR
jgi:hypothetical protein